jgi:hypothetical protein
VFPPRDIESPAIVRDDAGGLHVVYLHQITHARGIYYLYSEDNGESWEPPLLLSKPGVDWTIASAYYAFDLLLVGDTLHIAWEQRGQEDSGIFYVQGRARDWSYPRAVAPGGIWPKLATMDDGRLLLLSTGVVPGIETICLKRQNVSLDGGNTWSPTQRILEPVAGCLGSMHVLRDNDGGYHLVASAYVEYTYVEKIWSSEWVGKAWSRPELASWAGVLYKDLGRQPDFPNATISEGNVLHAVFHVDEGHIWYIRRPLSASQLPRLAYPAPTSDVPDKTELVAAGTLPITPEPTFSPIATWPPQESELAGRPLGSGSAIVPSVVGGIAGATLIGIALAWSYAGRRK